MRRSVAFRSSLESANAAQRNSTNLLQTTLRGQPSVDQYRAGDSSEMFSYTDARWQNGGDILALKEIRYLIIVSSSR